MKEVKTKSNISLSQVISDDYVSGHFGTNSEEAFQAVRNVFERYIFDGHAREVYLAEYDPEWLRYILILVDENFDPDMYFERIFSDQAKEGTK